MFSLWPQKVEKFPLQCFHGGSVMLEPRVCIHLFQLFALRTGAAVMHNVFCSTVCKPKLTFLWRNSASWIATCVKLVEKDESLASCTVCGCCCSLFASITSSGLVEHRMSRSQWRLPFCSNNTCSASVFPAKHRRDVVISPLSSCQHLSCRMLNQLKAFHWVIGTSWCWSVAVWK